MMQIPKANRRVCSADSENYKINTNGIDGISNNLKKKI
jgi:hypothetical protein